MGIKQREVYVCDACGWEWIPRGGEKVPTNCPNRKCRSRKWNHGRDDSALDSGGVQREESVVRKPEESKKPAKGQLSAEEFMKLSGSEQLRARREGKF